MSTGIFSPVSFLVIKKSSCGTSVFVFFTFLILDVYLSGMVYSEVGYFVLLSTLLVFPSVDIEMKKLRTVVLMLCQIHRWLFQPGFVQSLPWILSCLNPDSVNLNPDPVKLNPDLKSENWRRPM